MVTAPSMPWSFKLGHPVEMAEHTPVTWDSPLRIVVGSAGRRLYLVRWFKDALARLKVPGEVIVLEHDSSSASFGYGDRSFRIPAYADPKYEVSMNRLFSELRPHLFFSVNDYELDALSQGLAEELRSWGGTVLSLSAAEHRIATDKYALFESLDQHDVATPRTVLASDVVGVAEFVETFSEFIVKHRFGSGSSGLRFVDRDGLASAILDASATAPSSDGTLLGTAERRSGVVIQQKLAGEEFGVDGIFSLSEGDGLPLGVLARQKLRMRSGETDKAMTVEPTMFAESIQQLGAILRPGGLIDVDVVLDDRGNPNIIDVNPRFGGGYPFSHLAGADVPAFYVASVLGRAYSSDWLWSEAGTVSSKYEEIRVTSTASARA